MQGIRHAPPVLALTALLLTHAVKIDLPNASRSVS